MATAAEIRPLLSETANSSAVGPFPRNPEFDLLVACCADSSDSAHPARILNLLSRPLDWERVLRLVDHHRVVPQLHGELSALSHLVPVRAFSALRSRYQENARKALWFSGELVRILGHLESRGIKVLPYKGPVLAQTLYREVTQRQFGDLDVLILSTDVPKAKAALLDLGYQPSSELGPHAERAYIETAYIETAYIETGYEYSLSATSRKNLLELQWRVVPRFYSIDFDVADFFARADEIIVGGRSMPTLCPQDLLLVLCVHAAKHLWVQLSWLCDIAQLVNSPRLDWNAIQNNAQRLGIERIVILNLLLAHELLATAVPPQIQKRLPEDPSTTVLAGEILRILESSTHYDTESIPYFRWMMRLRERWQDRARFLWRLAFTPSVGEWSVIRLPKHLQPLYRLVRLFRLVKRFSFAG